VNVPAAESSEAAKSIPCDLVANPDAVNTDSANDVAESGSVDINRLSILNIRSPVLNVLAGTLNTPVILPVSSVDNLGTVPLLFARIVYY
jgi:hypothetical protein